MTTYYVKPASSGGSDVAAGTAVGTAWATIDKAANTVAAGDTVWICPGVYRELVTMDTSGSSGSPITYNGDFDGTYFGVIGPVIVSAWDDDTSTPTRASCWDMNNKTYIVVNKIMFMGGTSFCVGNTSNASATAYEGCEFNDCVMQSSNNDYAIQIELNAGVTPTDSGLTIRRCAIVGHMRVEWDSQASANNNLKWTIERCFVSGFAGTATGIQFIRVTNGGSNTIAGVTIRHCTFMSFSNAISAGNLADTTNPFRVYNNVCLSGTTAIAGTATAGTFISSNNVIGGSQTAVSNATEYPDSVRTDVPIMVGGIHDWLYYQTYGWSPFKPWEPMTVTGFTNPATGYGTLDTATSNDVYAQAAMGRPSAFAHIYYFDGSDAAVTDPNSVWTNEANITDTSLSTAGTVASNGSTNSNFAMVEGTNAPGSGGTISTVYARVRYSFNITSVSNAGEVKVYTDTLGELLGTLTMTNNTSSTWTDWAALSAPTGGWTWAKVQSLEIKAYRTGGNTLSVFQVQVYALTTESAPDAGIVEANTQPTQNSTDEYEGTYCMELSGAGYYQFWQPVSAAATNISVQAKYDGNYTGTKPQLVVTNIPGVSDQTDTVGGASGSYEQLSVAFTPTSAGFVRVKLVSNDTSTNGKCFFDDIQVS